MKIICKPNEISRKEFASLFFAQVLESFDYFSQTLVNIYHICVSQVSFNTSRDDFRSEWSLIGKLQGMIP
jgi:hypothetical protein